ncbi:HIRAN domain-containing protein [Echinicola marina]|uniref:HIRAN domain-containing protein n=1 Tax=Echinicola marina TaxID=2859768 RepID=UPI001CF69356|nr:HIRAN domain-containing protein [Echinicola marina]UCS92152.1 HIRAN domain-containing protein [Echinicola marina]
MREIGHIYLTWREGQGKRRYIVGVLKRNATEGVSFRYLKEEVEKAAKDGFSPYTEFPDVKKEYKQGVLESFGQRIMKSERADIKDFYDFWEIDPKYKEDKYYMLAHTQGLNPTDNFEFLAEYNPIKDLRFLTDLASLSKLKLEPNTVKTGDELTYQLEPKNPRDSFAVKVLKGDKEVGYIKRIHSKVFHRSKWPLKIKVKAVEQNGTIKRIFVKVCA